MNGSVGVLYRLRPFDSLSPREADAVCAATPLVAVLAQVPDFHLQDDTHEIYTEMCSMMAETAIPLPTLHLFDARLGGWIHRKRGITIFEAPSLREVPPSWLVHMPHEEARPRGASWMQPIDLVNGTIRSGRFRLASPVVTEESALSSQVPVVIGWLQWGGPTTPLQADILVSI